MRLVGFQCSSREPELFLMYSPAAAAQQRAACMTVISMKLFPTLYKLNWKRRANGHRDRVERGKYQANAGSSFWGLTSAVILLKSVAGGQISLS